MTDPIVEKIKKLLRLGQSSNQHEAELALQRAFELAARHNVDLAGIDIDEETKKILHENFHVGGRFSLIRKLALQICMTYFNVHVVMYRPNIIFIGTASDIQIAIYVHDFLTWACSKALSRYAKTQRRKLSKTKRSSFIAGFMYGVSRKLTEAKEQLQIEESKTALILAAEHKRQQYQDAHFRTKRVELDPTPRRNWTALEHGHHAGRNIQINPGLTGANQAPKQLTF